MAKNISIEPIQEEDIAPGPEVPVEPEVPKELDTKEPEPELEPEPEPEPEAPEPEIPEATQPAPKRRGRPKKEAAPVEKKPRGRPKKEPPQEDFVPEQPMQSTSSSFTHEAIGNAIQQLLAAHHEAKAQKRRETYSKVNMFE